jgi:hypothetical protein
MTSQSDFLKSIRPFPDIEDLAWPAELKHEAKIGGAIGRTIMGCPLTDFGHELVPCGVLAMIQPHLGFGYPMLLDGYGSPS